MMYLATHGSTAATNLAPYLVAIVILAIPMFGVILYLDYTNENMYVETKPTFSKSALRAALACADWLGLEVLGEDEDVPQVTACGGTRIYLAQRCGLP